VFNRQDDNLPETDDNLTESEDNLTESDDNLPESDDNLPESDDNLPESLNIASESKTISVEILGFWDRAGPGYAFLRTNYIKLKILNCVRVTIIEGRTHNCHARGLSKLPSRRRKVSRK
jgi:hypothetical protein